KRSSTSEASTMSQATIRKLVAESITATLETQTLTMAEADNPIRNTRPREIPIAKKRNFKEFISCQPFYFNGTEEVVGLIRCKGPAIGSNLQPVSVIFLASGEKGHYQSQCSKSNINANERTYLMRDKNAHQDPNVVTVTLDTNYNIKKADGNLISINTIIGCTLTLFNQPFEINLMPMKLGSFDVVIGMDWLSKYHAKIIYDEKVVHIPIEDETLIIRDNQSRTRLSLVSCIKTERYISRGCQVFIAQVMEKKLDEKRLENILVVREFPDVFLEELHGLPPVRQVEFLIDLILGAAPVARAPYD
nr:putative reverse transcriptase domain-containing protein [Tanacetum cinerariifolium]